MGIRFEARVDDLVRALGAARGALEARCREVDDLNVFPVPDGDTGTNMLITARAAEDALRAAGPADDPWQAVARGALAGARGNSGMILSQLVAGAAGALAAAPDPDRAVAAAFRAGADAAYRAVRRPVEGTILTVAAAMAVAAEAVGAQEPEVVLEAALAAGRQALERTTEQLAALAEAGVVDSGALGLVLLVEGLTTAVTGRPVADPVSVARGGPRAIDHPPSRFRFCTSFLVDGPAIDLVALEARLAGLGDSLLVVGDSQRAKVHLHTDEPPRALAAAAAWGAVDGLAVEDMHRQQAERTRRLSAPGLCTAVAVAVGPGHRLLLEGLGAVAVAVDGLPAALAGVTGEAVVLPAGPETAAAAHVAASATGAVLVEDVAGPVAALSCLLAFDPTRPAAENAVGMAEQAAAVAVGAVALDGEEAPAPALEALLRHLLPGDDPAVVTVLVGVEAAGLDLQAVRESLAREHPQAEVEVHYGGQPAPVYLVGVER